MFFNIGRNSCGEPDDSGQLVPHSATGRFEIGNHGLEIETSRNIEIGLRKHAGDVLGVEAVL